MKNLIKATLLMVIACQASAQNMTREMPAKINLALQKDSQDLFGKKAPTKKLDFNSFEGKDSKDLGILKEKSLNLKDVETKFSAGGHDGNGGVTATDENGKRRLLDLIEKDELIYFFPDSIVQSLKYDKYSFAGLIYQLLTLAGRYEAAQKLPAVYNYKKDDFLLGEPTFAFNFISAIDARNNLMNHDPKLWATFNINIAEPLQWAFVDSELEKINDEGVVRIENPNTRKQVAIQKDGLVVISRTEFNLLDENSKVALFLHEAVLRAVLLTNPQNIIDNGTENVRTYTRRLFNYMQSPSTTPGRSTRQAYEDFRIIDNSTYWKK